MEFVFLALKHFIQDRVAFNILFLSDDNMKTVNWRVLPYGTKPSFTREGVVDLLLAPLMPVCVPATGQDW